MVPKNLEKSLEGLEMRGRIQTIQTTALYKLARILTEETYCYSDFSECWCEKLTSSEIIIIMIM